MVLCPDANTSLMPICQLTPSGVFYNLIRSKCARVVNSAGRFFVRPQIGGEASLMSRLSMFHVIEPSNGLRPVAF